MDTLASLLWYNLYARVRYVCPNLDRQKWLEFTIMLGFLNLRGFFCTLCDRMIRFSIYYLKICLHVLLHGDRISIQDPNASKANNVCVMRRDTPECFESQVFGSISMSCSGAHESKADHDRKTQISLSAPIM